MNKNKVSGLMLAIMLVGMLTLAVSTRLPRASGTIYIRAGGAIDPDDGRIVTEDKVHYYFTEDIHDSIVVERDNIVVDGEGYVLEGTGVGFPSGTGISLSARVNVTIQNMEIRAFYLGVDLEESLMCDISMTNILSNTQCGIWLGFSSNNVLSGNTITNSFYGIGLFYSSSSNVLSGNTITNSVYGISLSYSSNNNVLSGNTITNSGDKGIYLVSSDNNTLSKNTIAYNNDSGVYLDSSGNNNMSENTITNNNFGVFYDSDSSTNLVYRNNFLNNEVQVVQNDLNSWDYRSEGNYWSDYEGEDLDLPANLIGDTLTPHHKDRYPFIIPIGPIPVFWRETRYDCIVGGNVTVSRFKLEDNSKTISFNMTGHGFTGLTIPRNLTDGAFKVFIDNNQIPRLSMTTIRYLDWTKTHTEIELECESSTPVSVEIEWEIRIIGDLNGDDECNIFDVVTIAKHFGETL